MSIYKLWLKMNVQPGLSCDFRRHSRQLGVRPISRFHPLHSILATPVRMKPTSVVGGGMPTTNNVNPKWMGWFGEVSC